MNNMTDEYLQITDISRTKAEAKLSYTKMANWYDIFGIFERRYRLEGIKLLNAHQDETILEIGFGTGNSLRKLASAVGYNGLVLGVDISEGMCKKANQKMRKANLKDVTSLQCADATFLPYKDNIIDRIFLSFTLELFSIKDIYLVLKECKRVLTPKGKLIIVTLSRRKLNLMVRTYEWFHKKFSKIIDCRPILAAEILFESGYQILSTKHMTMWGLPVDIFLSEV